MENTVSIGNDELNQEQFIEYCKTVPQEELSKVLFGYIIEYNKVAKIVTDSIRREDDLFDMVDELNDIIDEYKKMVDLRKVKRTNKFMELFKL